MVEDPPRIPEEHLRTLRKFIQRRDRAAERLGAATYEYHALVARTSEMIRDSLREERAVARAVLAQMGEDPDRCDIDLETGVVLRGEGG